MNIDVKFESSDMGFAPEFAGTVFAGGGSSGGGTDGVTFYPHVSADGVISWTNDGNLPNPAPVNIKGKDGADGKNGADGKDGIDGRNGIDGHTPVKGTDYWTESDKAQMVADVIAALPVYNGEVV